jgi:hypothetical protein
MRVFITAFVAAVFILAAVLGFRSNAGSSADTTDVLSASSSKPAGAGEAKRPSFIELHNNAHLENLPIQSIPDLIKP